jgi:DNA modification methylase
MGCAAGVVMLPIDQIICGRNEDVLAGFPAGCVDLTVTSPPYDNLRAYKGYTWDFDAAARELWRVTKPGGVVVWVVADATVDGSETGTSFRQALGFMALGFRLHDTMIYEKESGMPHPPYTRYCQQFEYMFVLSKGMPKTTNVATYPKTGEVKKTTRRAANGAIKPGVWNVGGGALSNVWRYGTGGTKTTPDHYAYEHPGVFPEKLAEDHILSWSNPGDVVLDPFVGSGTTPKMAIKHHRHFIGIDISEEYCALARRRIGAVQPVMFDVGTL